MSFKSSKKSEEINNKNNKKPYSAPKVLSVEKLEAAAATCEPAVPPLGKSIPIPCGTLGS